MIPTTPQESLFFSTVRVLTGPAVGQWQGTGTAFGCVFQRDGLDIPFLVTNKHVVAGAAVGCLQLNLLENGAPRIGHFAAVVVDQFANRWHGHPSPEVDVAVLPIGPISHDLEQQGKPVFLPCMPLSLLPTKDQLASLFAIEDVFFVGYPNGISDEKNNLPIMRKGTTATPLSVDYNGKSQFLIDASVFPGSSGSPVVICNTGGFATKSGFAVGSRLFLLGIVSSVFFRTENNTIRYGSIPTAITPHIQSREMIDLGVVWKSSTILETIEDFISRLPPEALLPPPR